jgi:GWxTD domain-containing protein
MSKFNGLGVVLALAVVVLTGCATPPRVAQENPDERHTEVGQPAFSVDWAGFRGADTLSRLEIYYQVFNFGLQFTKDGSDFVANYLFAIVINDNNGHQIVAQEQERSVRTAEYGKTISRLDYRTSQMNFALAPGTYKIICSLKDKNSNSVTNREFTVKLRNFNSGMPSASDVQFAHAIDTGGGEQSVFRKGSLMVIPIPSRYYGEDDSALLSYYFEVYRGESDMPMVKVEATVRSAIRGTVSRDTASVELTDSLSRQVRTLSLEQCPPGDYELELKLLGHRGHLIDERSESFSLQWTQEGLLRHDYRTALDQLRYIAGPSEIKKMQNLETYEERLEAFNAFWAGRDPTVGTRENETKREFYRRVAYANRQFPHLRQPGWRTDRGRIYVQNGDPDQIDDVPMSPSYPPYQIWHYYRQGSYRRFAFVDQNDDGDYRLQYPFDGLNMRPDF